MLCMYAIKPFIKRIACLTVEAGVKLITDDETALINAVVDRKYNLVERLLEYQVDVDERGSHNMTALMWASIHSNIEIVKLLLKQPLIDVNVQNDFGKTALMLATRYDIYVALLEYKANMDLRDEDGKTALMKAIPDGNADVPKLLIDAGANVNIADRNGRTALMYATNATIAEHLITHAANIDAQDTHGDTALMRASRIGLVHIIELLLMFGANHAIRNKDGKTALELASYNARLLLLKL